MNCPHCGKEVYSGMNDATPMYSSLINNNGCNPNSFTLVFNNAACANTYPAQALNISGVTLNAAVAGCNPFPQVTYIEF